MGNTASRPAASQSVAARAKGTRKQRPSILTKMSHPSLFFKDSSRFSSGPGGRSNAHGNGPATPTDVTLVLQDERRVRKIEAYAVFKRQDPALDDAVDLLRNMRPKQRLHIKNLVESIIQCGGSGRITRDAKYDELIRMALGQLCIDRALEEPEEWSEETRMWEMKKFAGLMFYALKLVDAGIMEHSETIPDYLLRKSKNRLVPPVTVVSTYTPDGRDLRSHIEKYTPQIFNASNWTKIAPLMWLIQPKYSAYRDDSSPPSGTATEPQPKFLRPKIIAIEIPGETYLLYRFFPFHNTAYEQFLASVAPLSDVVGTQLNNQQIKALMDADPECHAKSDPVDANRLMMAWAGDTRNGSLAGEVRFALACCERGVEVCTTIQEAGWLALWGNHEEGEYGFVIAEATWEAEDTLLDFLRPGSEIPWEGVGWQAGQSPPLDDDDNDGNDDGDGEDVREVYRRLSVDTSRQMLGVLNGYRNQWILQLGSAYPEPVVVPMEQQHRIAKAVIRRFKDEKTYEDWKKPKTKTEERT
ncbi:hypothetical protein Dda_4356 [Drechslerella dactyloides]|uniref:Uncharacterized protein n=1 Tax=Drechslerella dactyloides TaxID=74499 RepID=A0AAD6IY51_DREDA|nr:hypothetical protein Dda_4356 [Drechslerella dactyloides]